MFFVKFLVLVIQCGSYTLLSTPLIDGLILFFYYFAFFLLLRPHPSFVYPDPCSNGQAPHHTLHPPLPQAIIIHSFIHLFFIPTWNTPLNPGEGYINILNLNYFNIHWQEKNKVNRGIQTFCFSFKFINKKTNLATQLIIIIVASYNIRHICHLVTLKVHTIISCKVCGLRYYEINSFKMVYLVLWRNILPLKPGTPGDPFSFRYSSKKQWRNTPTITQQFVYPLTNAFFGFLWMDKFGNNIESVHSVC